MIRVLFFCSLHFGLVWSILQYEGFSFILQIDKADKAKVKQSGRGGGLWVVPCGHVLVMNLTCKRRKFLI